MVKVFLAGAEAFYELLKDKNFNILMNYFYIKDNKKIISSDIIKEYGCALFFLDSGAFTAWTKGVHIPIEEYCEFVKTFSCSFYSVLDVIGDAEGTLKNQKKMEELGTTPVPCFHFGDDFKYLDYYYENYDFISLGGMVGRPTKQLKLWLDKIFLMYPDKKYHGFGLTRKKLIEQYPWYSVDSSSWIQTNMTKRIYSADFNQYLYLGKNNSIYQLILKNPENKKWIDKIKLYGVDIENLFNDYKQSLIFNAYGFAELENVETKNNILNQRTLF